MGFTCPICGKHHDEFPMDLAYRRPAGYFKVPEDEREERIYFTEDVCIIDEQEFYIRGILEIPVTDSAETFCFGIWAKVEKKDFQRYMDLWDVPEITEAPLTGFLSGGVKYYDNSNLLEVWIHLQPDGDRPKFQVKSKTHPLGRDQCEGITMKKVHEFVESLLGE